MANGTLPAIPFTQLGTFADFEIEVATVPFLLGAIQELTNPENYFGDEDDIEATCEAFRQLMKRLSL